MLRILYSGRSRKVKLLVYTGFENRDARRTCVATCANEQLVFNPWSSYTFWKMKELAG